MASCFDEQSAAGMGRRKKGARRAQTYRADDEGAARGEEYPRDSGNARSSRGNQESPARGMDVLWTLSRPDGDYRGNGRVPTRETEDRWADQGYGEPKAGESVLAGNIHGITEREHGPGYSGQDTGGSYAGDQTEGASCIRGLDERSCEPKTSAQRGQT